MSGSWSAKGGALARRAAGFFGCPFLKGCRSRTLERGRGGTGRGRRIPGSPPPPSARTPGGRTSGALRRLDAWLAGRRLEDATLAGYLAELHEQGRAPSSASTAVAAARFRARLAGEPSPAGKRTARVLAGYRRTAASFLLTTSKMVAVHGAPLLGFTMIGSSGKLYLAAVLDVFSRFVVGWAVSAINDRHLVIKALQLALKRRRPPLGLLHHSDRGSPYASEDYLAILTAHGMLGSMSRRGDCHDNAVMESWFSTVKFELGEHFETCGEAKMELFDYRQHSQPVHETGSTSHPRTAASAANLTAATDASRMRSPRYSVFRTERRSRPTPAPHCACRPRRCPSSDRSRTVP